MVFKFFSQKKLSFSLLFKKNAVHLQCQHNTKTNSKKQKEKKQNQQQKQAN